MEQIYFQSFGMVCLVEKKVIAFFLIKILCFQVYKVWCASVSSIIDSGEQQM